MLSIADVLEILSLPLLGIIPEDKEVLRASNLDRERLQILLAQEPSALGTCNPVSILMEILATISSHVEQKPDKVQVKMDRGAAVSTLQIELEIPNMAEV